MLLLPLLQPDITFLIAQEILAYGSPVGSQSAHTAVTPEVLLAPARRRKLCMCCCSFGFFLSACCLLVETSCFFLEINLSYKLLPSHWHIHVLNSACAWFSFFIIILRKEELRAYTTPIRRLDSIVQQLNQYCLSASNSSFLNIFIHQGRPYRPITCKSPCLRDLNKQCRPTTRVAIRSN